MHKSERLARGFKDWNLGAGLEYLQPFLKEVRSIRDEFGSTPWILIKRNGRITSASTSVVTLCIESLTTHHVQSLSKRILVGFHLDEPNPITKRELRLLRTYSIDAVISIPLHQDLRPRYHLAWHKIRDQRLTETIEHREMSLQQLQDLFLRRQFALRDEGLKHIRLNALEAKPELTALGVYLEFTGQHRNRNGSPKAEFEALANTLNISIPTVLEQRMSRPQSGTYLGSGRYREICDRLNAEDWTHCLLNVDVPASLKQRITHETLVEVWDRTDLILRIFQEHARTEKARLQVELARLEYNAGEEMRQALQSFDYDKGYDLYEQNLRLQVAKKRKEILDALEKSHKQQETRQAVRSESNVLSVAVLGYTNAGKSTLFNTLLGSEEAAAEDKLFKTLETTSRTLNLSSGLNTMILTDTVGFIQNLPRHLNEAFHSTLEEARNATYRILLLDPQSMDLVTQKDCVLQSLEQIGVSSKPVLIAINKSDLLSSHQKKEIQQQLNPDFFICAKDPESVREFEEGLLQWISGQMKTMEIEIPHASYGSLHQLKAWATLPREPEYLADCIRIQLAYSEENEHHIKRILNLGGHHGSE